MREKLIIARGNRTQQEVADKLGITQKHLSKIELEQRNPSILLASKISDFYKLPVEYLFDDIFLKSNTS